MEATTDASPRRLARLAGVFYLLNIVTGASSLAFTGRGRGGIATASNLVATVCYVVVTLLFFQLFKRVDRTVSLVAACVSLVGCSLGALGILGFSLPMSPLVFFGAYCLLIGFLILRSPFLPAFLGVLMVIGGLGWLTFASRTLSAQLAPYNFMPGILGEFVLTVWLLVKGVDADRWTAHSIVTRTG
jgi:hypothetical protein